MRIYKKIFTLPILFVFLTAAASKSPSGQRFHPGIRCGFLLPHFTITTARSNDSIDPAKQVNQPIVITNSMEVGRMWASIASRINAVVAAYSEAIGELSIDSMALPTYEWINPGSTNIRYNADSRQHIRAPNITE